MQDRAIIEIGQLEFEKDKNLKPYQLFTQEPYPNKVCKMLLIEFDKLSNGIRFKGIDIQNSNENNYFKFAYRKGSSRGGDITFTTKCSSDLGKKLNTLLNNQFPKFLELAQKTDKEEFDLFTAIKMVFLEKREAIETQLQQSYDDLTKDEQKVSAFSLSVTTKDGKKHFLSDFETIRKQLELDGVEGNYKKYSVVSKGEYKTCSICHNEKDVVFGFGSPFKYSTVDKESFVSGFFDQKKNWINYPICEKCALEMELGKNYIFKNLKKYFFGHSYFIIPKTVIPGDLENLNNALDIIKDVEYRFEKNKGEDVTSSEDFLLKDLGAVSKNVFTLNFMFFEENSTTKAMKIKLLLEEIPPSRFRKLFIEVPEKINDNPFYKNALYYSKQKQHFDLKFSFRLIKQFFEDQFYEMVYKIFKGGKINSNDLYQHFMIELISNKNKKNNQSSYDDPSITVKKAFLLKSYLDELNLINYNN